MFGGYLSAFTVFLIIIIVVLIFLLCGCYIRYGDEIEARENAMAAARSAQEAQKRSEERFEDHRKQMEAFLAKPLQINFDSEDIARTLAYHLAPILHKDWIN